jgi:carboxymethylenebutenolidase
MPAYLGLPSSPNPPGVLVCMHAPGVDTFIQGICDRLAAAGFAAISPDVYHRQANADPNPLARMGRLKDEELLEDQAAASRHLATVSDPSRQHVIGFCMGGRQSYLWATEVPTLKSAVVFYGGSIMRGWGASTTPFDRTPGIQCPMLGLFGKEDTNPSPGDVAKISAELTRLGKVHEFVSYDGAGHAFLNDTRPTYRPEAARDAWQRCVNWLNKHSN